LLGAQQCVSHLTAVELCAEHCIFLYWTLNYGNKTI